jgi:ligand-binding SRPBCC domain-containing protein
MFMKVYHLKRLQFIPIGIYEAWNFFSSPINLSKITPAKLNFNILYASGGNKIYAGQIIKYKLRVLPGIKINWTTEITHVHEPHYFVDEQRFGPYALWHHQHHFKLVPGGVEIIDEVNYAIPFGLVGRLVNWIFVKHDLHAIFDYRFKVLENYFLKHPIQNQYDI